MEGSRCDTWYYLQHTEVLHSGILIGPFRKDTLTINLLAVHCNCCSLALCIPGATRRLWQGHCQLIGFFLIHFVLEHHSNSTYCNLFEIHVLLFTLKGFSITAPSG